MTRVVTDGAADLPNTATDVAVVRGPVRVGGELCDDSPGRFWAEIAERGELPATEAPPVDRLAAAYAGREAVLAVHVSGELSSTVRNARAASAISACPVQVIDSRSLSVGTGLVVAAAAEAVAAGVEGGPLVRTVEGWVDRLHVHALIDDPGFLVHGGRAGLVAAKVGRRSHRHVVAVKGHVIPICEVRQRAEALRVLTEHAREHATGGVTRWAVGHGAAPDVGELVERMTAAFGCEPAYVTLLGLPVGAHMGPRSLVVGFVSPA